MKVVLVIALSLGLGAVAHAGEGSYKASKYACKDLQKLLIERGELKIRKFLTVTYVRSTPSCEQMDVEATSQKIYFRTADMENCQLGWYCKFPQQDPWLP